MLKPGGETFNGPSDEEELEVKAEISTSNAPEDFDTGRETFNTPYDNEEFEVQAGISTTYTP